MRASHTSMGRRCVWHECRGARHKFAWHGAVIIRHRSSHERTAAWYQSSHRSQGEEGRQDDRIGAMVDAPARRKRFKLESWGAMEVVQQFGPFRRGLISAGANSHQRAAGECWSELLLHSIPRAICSWISNSGTELVHRSKSGEPEAFNFIEPAYVARQSLSLRRRAPWHFAARTSSLCRLRCGRGIVCGRANEAAGAAEPRIEGWEHQ